MSIVVTQNGVNSEGGSEEKGLAFDSLKSRKRLVERHNGIIGKGMEDFFTVSVYMTVQSFINF